MSCITAIGTATPAHRFEQSTIAEFMLRSMQLNGNGDGRKLKAVFRQSGILFRHSVLEDFGVPVGNGFFAVGQGTPTTEQRLEIFRKHATSLSVAAINDMRHSMPSFDAANVTHLVVVCCTGMYAPGLDIDLVRAVGLRSTVQRTAINFMGCYAAFNALKLADAICRTDDSAKVLVVCTELCSLHFQAMPSDDNLLANALFADGSGAILVEPSAGSHLSLRFEAFHNDLAIEGEKDMAWTIGDLGFEMKLSSYIPDVIQGGIVKLAASLLEKIARRISDIQHFALHPGGKRILQSIEKALDITPYQNRHAYSVLQQYGNMSSATVVFVLKELVHSLGRSNLNEHILSFAFGPGLTMESMVLEIENV